jgi:hypothetical protein
MRRITVVVVLLLVAVVWPAAHGLAHRSTTTHAAADGSLQADFNNDGFPDLVVGVLGEDVGAVEDAGAVNVLAGSAGGLTGVGSQIFTQNSLGVPGVAEPGDLFGEALAAGDFDSDSFADLAVGVLGEDVDTFQDAGAINLLPGSAAGLTGTGSQLFTQDSPGVPDSVEHDDFFGSALAASGP